MTQLKCLDRSSSRLGTDICPEVEDMEMFETLDEPKITSLEGELMDIS